MIKWKVDKFKLKLLSLNYLLSETEFRYERRRQKWKHLENQFRNYKKNILHLSTTKYRWSNPDLSDRRMLFFLPFPSNRHLSSIEVYYFLNGPASWKDWIFVYVFVRVLINNLLPIHFRRLQNDQILDVCIYLIKTRWI